MANLTSVTVTNGVPTGGTGTVSTIDNLANIVQQNKVTDGTNTAAVKPASTAPAATDPALVVTISPNGINPNIGNNADGLTPAASNIAPMGAFGFVFNGSTWDRLKSGFQKVASSLAVAAKSGGSKYQSVAASSSAVVLGTTGAVGDYLESLVCVVTTAATSQVQITDGSGSAIPIFPNNPGPGIGTYPIPIGAISTSGAWKVTTGAGVSVMATGDFT